MNTFGKIVRLGDLLRHMEKITERQLNDALQTQKISGKKIGECLIDNGYITEEEIMGALSYQLGLRVVDLDNCYINCDATKLISEKLARRSSAIPIKIEGDKVIVAMNDPLNIFDIEDIEMSTGKKVEIVLSSKFQIENAIEKYLGRQSAEKAVEDFNRENTVEENLNKVDDEVSDNVRNAPVVRLINSVIRQALKMGASDIHIEPYANKLRVRVRIDGDLQDILTPSKQTQSALVTRIKIIAGLNIAEKRLPQDGRVEMKVDDTTVDMRISILPTVYGEKIVIRIHDMKNFLKDRQELGFTKSNLRVFDEILEALNGVVLVTGPTGSGKTTTLYTILNGLNKVNKNIITVEDPVEYKLEGINQVQVNTKIGMQFSTGLRSMLRQDPDIIMIGEIRDEETAEIAIRAAITGHLVISTVHTNDASSTIMRLFDMGVKPFLVAASLRGVVAQRLVKRVCQNCKTEYKATEFEKELLETKGDVTLYKGSGCTKCYNTGYRGRIAINEIMKIEQHIREVIYNKGSLDQISQAARHSGMKTLRESCKDMVLSGITSMEEFYHIVYTLD